MWRACRSMEMKHPGPPGTSPGGSPYATSCSKSVQNMVSIKVQNVSLLYYGGILVVLRDDQGLPGMLRNDQGCSGMVQECLGMLRDGQGRSRTVRDTQGCSGMLRDAQGCSGMLRDAQGCSEIPEHP